MNALAQTHPPFTSAEFYRMAEKGAFAGFRVELRRGMILKMSPQHYPHGAAQADLFRRLGEAIRHAGLGWDLQMGTTIGYGNGFEPMPDIVVFDPMLIENKEGVLTPAAIKLVVEVSDSTLADDLGDKLEDYAQAGLAEYWVADVKAKTVIRHAEPVGKGFARTEAGMALDQSLTMLTEPGVVVRA